MMSKKLQPAGVWSQHVLTNVDGCDSGHGQILTSDGHSSTAGHWTVQWTDTFH